MRTLENNESRAVETRMGRLNQVWKRRLLSGVALACVLAAVPLAAQAQNPAPIPLGPTDQAQNPAPIPFGPAGQTQKPAPIPLGPADQAIGSGVYLEADTVIRDDANHTWIAKGSVEARYKGKVVRADELDIDQATSVVTAKGDVQLLNPDGTSEFGSSIVMDKDFTAGLALAFSTRQEPNVKIVADEAIRLNKDAMALNKAVFTVCDICDADGTPKVPTWSIEASNVIQDHDAKVIIYRHAVIRVKGLPVLYLPLFWHTDPTAKRGSGFLQPQIALDGRRGFSYEQPYLWVISPYADLVVSPQINTKVAPLLNTEYRERFYSGQIDVRLGYTYAQEFDSGGHVYDNETSRSYILSSGVFAPTPNLTWGFSAERVTDPLLFQRYAVPNAFDPRGLFATDDQRLLSQLFAVEQDSRSYISVSMMSFQGLRVGDQNGTFPLVAPLVEARYDPNVSILGGRLRLEGSGVLLQRTRSVATDVAPGEDSRRASFSGDWRSAYTFYNGIRLEPFAEARGDLYNVNGVSATDTGLHTTGRVLGTAGVDASWPFFRRTGDLTVVLEPLAQLAVSPKATTNPYILNEDSQVIDFDETNLFEANKSPGFDYYEGGARANVGGRMSLRWDGGGQVQLLAGRSLRTVPDPTLPARTSLDQTESDWVIAASAAPITGFNGFSRALLDGRSGQVRRLEAGVNAGTSRLSGFLRYFYDDVDLTSGRSENLGAGGQLLVTKHWGVSASVSLDIANKASPLEAVGLVYQDECIHWELIYAHNGTYNRTLHPNDTVMMRLLLVTLGSSGYQRSDFR